MQPFLGGSPSGVAQKSVYYLHIAGPVTVCHMRRWKDAEKGQPDMKKTASNLDRRAALRIVAIYSLFAAIWIYFSDTALDLLTSDPHLMVRLSVLKGFLFIIVTALLLFRLISQYLSHSRATWLKLE